jgi:Tol biopolymer transport system component
VVFPFFSPDGSKLLWAGNTGEYPEDSIFGERALYLADFKLVPGQPPTISNQQVLQPGEQHDFYESAGFSPDGYTILFSANLRTVEPVKEKTQKSVLGMDIFAYDLRNSTLKALTDTPEVWDEFPCYSPDGRKIIWMSSAGMNVRFFGGGEASWRNYLKSELWIMEADGSNPKQLTFFNSPGAGGYSGRRAFVGDCAWSPDGTRIAVCLNQETGTRALTTHILFLELGTGVSPQGGPAVSTGEEKTVEEQRAAPVKPTATPPAPVRRTTPWSW